MSMVPPQKKLPTHTSGGGGGGGGHIYKKKAMALKGRLYENVDFWRNY